MDDAQDSHIQADVCGVGMEANGIREVAAKLKTNVQEIIVGHGEAVDLAIIALLSKGHILVEDVPGIGKTTMAKALAQSLGCTFSRIQFTPDLMPTDVLGVNFYNQKAADFEFRSGPIFNQIVLADEINRATPRTQSALLEAMGEGQATIDGVTRPMQAPFMVLATQNPIDMEGTFPLPEAQLDRFTLRLKLGYPSADEEADILLRFQNDEDIPVLEPVTDGPKLIQLQRDVAKVCVDEIMRAYIVDITQATRKHENLSLGVSPRAALALYKTSQAKASLEGRGFVSPDDVKDMANSVLCHRMLMTSNARLRGHTTERILAEVLESVPVPLER